MNKTVKSILALAVGVVALTSCSNGGTSKADSKPEVTDGTEITVDEFIGKWERHNAEGHYSLSIEADGTGKLISYGQSSSTTENFKYTVTGKGVVFEWGKLSKETYHAVLTVDGNYLVFDNGSVIFVYKKKGSNN